MYGRDSRESFSSAAGDRFVRSDRLAAAAFPASRAVVSAVLAALLAAWIGWFFLAEIPVLETSLQARLETAGSLRFVQATVDDRVAENHMELGREVAPGSVLVALDSEAQRHQLAERRARLAAAHTQLDSVIRMAASEEAALRASREADRVEEARAREQLEGSRAIADHSQRDAERVRAQQEAGIISLSEAERLQAEAASRRAEANEAGLVVEQSKWRSLSDAFEGRTRLDRLRHEQGQLAGEIKVLEAQIAGLLHEIELRQIRSPVAGRIVELNPLAPGAVVEEGERMGAVLPDGGLRIVALFSPAAAVGRIRPGQPALLRLDGFAWTEYGAVHARVAQVGAEPREGLVRVELDVAPGSASRIPQQHGQPGRVDVEVERVSPATLVLRAAGLIDAPAGGRPEASDHLSEVRP